MPIRCKAQQVDGGVEISEISTMTEAEGIRSYFAELGISAILPQPLGPDDCRVYLGRLSLEIFRKIAKGANIELAP